MAIVTVTKDGILRANETNDAFVFAARDRLKAAGFESTVWANYFIGRAGDDTYFATIRKSSVHVSTQRGFLFTTKNVNRVESLMCPV